MFLRPSFYISCYPASRRLSLSSNLYLFLSNVMHSYWWASNCWFKISSHQFCHLFSVSLFISIEHASYPGVSLPSLLWSSLRHRHMQLMKMKFRISEKIREYNALLAFWKLTVKCICLRSCSRIRNKMYCLLFESMH